MCPKIGADNMDPPLDNCEDDNSNDVQKAYLGISIIYILIFSFGFIFLVGHGKKQWNEFNNRLSGETLKSEGTYKFFGLGYPLIFFGIYCLLQPIIYSDRLNEIKDLSTTVCQEQGNEDECRDNITDSIYYIGLKYLTILTGVYGVALILGGIYGKKNYVAGSLQDAAMSAKMAANQTIEGVKDFFKANRVGGDPAPAPAPVPTPAPATVPATEV